MNLQQEQEMDEPTEEIPQNIKSTNDNYNNNGNRIYQENNNNNNNRINKNKFGYSNNQQNLNRINIKNQKGQMDKYNKGKNDKDCSIF